MTPPRPSFLLSLLGTGALCLAPILDPWSSRLDTDRSGSVLAQLLGDGRRLFANHFFAKADAYFHRGVYPSIFDAPRTENHMASGGDEDQPDPGHHHDHAEEAAGAGSPARPTDWIARLNDHLKPSVHDELEGLDTREILPWLKVSAELDPSNVQNFTVTAYWLRVRLNRIDEAEQFLREGLRYNPGNPEILFELGVLRLEGRKDPEGAANLLEQALRGWQTRETGKKQPDTATGAGILIRLARISEAQGRLPQAMGYLQQLRDLTPDPATIDQQIAELRGKLGTPAPAP